MVKGQPTSDTRCVQRILATTVSVFALLGPGAQASASGLPPLGELHPLEIHYGVNKIPAFSADGAAGIVVMVHRENGNAHSTDRLLVAVEGKPASPGVPGVPQLVEREESAASDSGLFGIEPFDGENEISALRLARGTVDGHATMLMLQAHRSVADAPALTDPTVVDLKVWRLDGPRAAVGVAPYRFVLVGSATTTRRYCNATTALNKELGLPFPDGWDNEDTRDGCNPAETRQRSAGAMEIVRGLDLTSFANSFGPRHLPKGTNLAAAGFDVVHAFDDGWVEARPADASWQIGVYVLDDAPMRKRVCITDQSLTGGTYKSVQAIDVESDGEGHWHAIGPAKAVAGCMP